MKVVVGVSGASGAILAKRLLEVLKSLGCEVHLVISDGAKLIIDYELAGEDLSRLADYSYSDSDFYAGIASGSFSVDAMVVIPCSMKTLSQIACGNADNLICRAADVCLKQERNVILVPRETPLNLIHLKNMVAAKEAGCSILPPVMAFYSKPKTIDDMVYFICGRVLDLLGVENDLFRRWDGKNASPNNAGKK